MNQFTNSGRNSATAPNIMKQSPMMGTTGTENIPPVITLVPYSNSQTPGIALINPARKSTIVNKPPATMGGDKLNTAFRPGPETSGMSTARAFRSMDQPAIKSEIAPSTSHTASHILELGWLAAIKLASNAVAPMVTSPQPDTPVKAVARSMVSRM